MSASQIGWYVKSSSLQKLGFIFLFVLWGASTKAQAVKTQSPKTNQTLALKTKTLLAQTTVNKAQSTAKIPQATAVTTDDSEIKYKADLTVFVLGRSIEDENLKSTVGWSFVKPNFEAAYSDWFKFKFSVVGIFGEGAAQNYLGEDGTGSNALVVDIAGIELKPFTPLSLSAGIIPYRINPLVTAMTPATSPGLEQKLELKDEKETVKFSLIGNEAIPSLGLNKTVVDKEKSPFFVTGTAQLDTKISALSSEIKLAATKFKFGNLPVNTAKGALLAGNSLSSVSGTGDDTRFVIGFSGTESAATLETSWTSSFKTKLKGMYIKNDLAFEENNQGKVFGLDFEYKRGNLIYSPWVTVFEMQSDVTPAVFTIPVNRLNNRKGYKTGFGIELVKQKLAFTGSYSNYEVLSETPFLSDREIYSIGLEANYDILK